MMRMRRDDSSGLFLIFIGAVVAAILGYAAYRMITKSQQTQNGGSDIITDSNIPQVPPKIIPYQRDNTLQHFEDYIENLPLERNPEEKQHPNYYYLSNARDIVGADAVSTPYIVENDETVTWTDWLGRERNVTISRKVR